MRLPSITEPPVEASALDDAALARHFDALLADPESSPRALCDVLWAACWRRLRAAASHDVLTRAEWITLDALMLQAQVLNGGFRQWIENGYHARTNSTLEALDTIGARHAARLLRTVRRALPMHVRAALAKGATVDEVPQVRVGPRGAAYLDRLDAVYDSTRSSEDIDTLVADYARRLLGPAASDLLAPEASHRSGG